MTQHIAFLGLGEMGSRIARSLLNAGFQVTVWNRTIRAFDELISLGAVVAPSPRVAANGASIVISMVRDDQASQRVWCDPDDGAMLGMVPDSIAIECSTVTPAHIRRLCVALRDRELHLLDAPVVGSRPQADAGQLIQLVGGDAAVLERVRPVLGAFGGQTVHVGESASGASMKLLVNALFGIQVAAVAELAALGQRSGLNMETIERVLAATPVLSSAAKAALSSMAKQAYAPMFPILLVTKDLGYLQDEASLVDAAIPVSEVVSKLFQAEERSGAGDRNITAIAQRYTRDKLH